MSIYNNSIIKFWMCFISFILAVLSLLLVFLNPLKSITTETFNGSVIGIITLLVTIIVGIQLYNSIELNQKLRQLELLKDQIYHQRKEINKTKLQQDDDFLTLEARLYQNMQGWEAYGIMSLIESIIPALSLNTDKSNVLDRIKHIRSFLMELSKLGSEKFFNNEYTADMFRHEWNQEMKYIRKHSKYSRIEPELEGLIEFYNEKVEHILYL